MIKKVEEAGIVEENKQRILILLILKQTRTELNKFIALLSK